MIGLSQAVIEGFPVHATLGQDVDGVVFDTLASLLASFDQTQLISSDQGMALIWQSCEIPVNMILKFMATHNIIHEVKHPNVLERHATYGNRPGLT